MYEKHRQSLLKGISRFHRGKRKSSEYPAMSDEQRKLMQGVYYRRRKRLKALYRAAREGIEGYDDEETFKAAEKQIHKEFEKEKERVLGDTLEEQRRIHKKEPT